MAEESEVDAATIAEARAKIAGLEPRLANDPDDVAAYLELADALCVVGAEVEAEARLQEAIQRRPEAPLLWDKMAAVRLKRGNLDGVVEALAEQVRRDPDNPNAYVNWFTFAMVNRDGEAAAQASNAFIERHPNHWRAHYIQARLFDLGQRPDRAREALERAHTLAPEAWEPLNDLGEMRNAEAFAQGDAEELAKAMLMLEEACRLAPPDQLEPRYNLALSYWNNGNCQAAAQLLEQLLARAPDDHPLLERAQQAHQAMLREL